MIIFLPSLSARMESRIRPVTLPANYADRIESLMYLSSQYKCICAVMVFGKSILHWSNRVQASDSDTFKSSPQVKVGVTSR